MSNERGDTVGYRALTSGVALLETERVVFHVHGSSAVRVVNGMVTNAVAGVTGGQGVYAFALSAKGRPIAEMRVLPVPGFETSNDEEEHLWVDVPAAAATGFQELLTRSVPPIFARVTKAEVRRFSLLGPAAVDHGPSILSGAGLEYTPEAEETEPLRATSVSLSEGLVGLLVGREAIELPGIDLYVPENRAETVYESLARGIQGLGDISPGGPAAVCAPGDWEIVRVERGLPIFGAEITDGNLPQETGQAERAVSFTKGCYTGQEVVARIHYRGHVNRVLRGLGDHEALAAGTSVYSAGRVVGSVETVVDSPRFGRIGLGYLRRSADPGMSVSLSKEGTADINVVELPFTKK